MKKLAMVFAVMIMLAVLTLVSAAWAGRSNLLSEPELDKIEAVARANYPKGFQFYMVVGDDFRGRYVVIQFFAKAKKQRQNLEIYVYPLTAYAEMSAADSDVVGEKVGVRIIEGVEKILNESPRAALGSIIK
jgi:hypothetical protein